MGQTLVMPKSEISSRNLLLKGTRLGFLGAIWGSLLFLALYFTVVLFVPVFFEAPEQISVRFFADFSSFYLVGFLITFFVSIIPATLAGFFNSWIHSSVNSSRKLSTRQSVTIGIIVGCLFCLIPTGLGSLSVEILSSLALHDFPSGAGVVREMVTVALTSMVTAALVGSWHSLKIYRYLAAPT